VGEVLIEGRRLDVKEGFNFSFNYSVADVRSPEKRSTEFSKTIQCPGTKANDLLFGQIYDVNISNPYDSTELNVEANFNPNKRAEARVTSDGMEVMAGTVQLRRIVMNGSEYTYEVVFIGKLINIFGVLKDRELNGLDEDGVLFLDFSDLDHTYNEVNIQSSWSNTSGYVYPMVDYGLGYDFDGNNNRIYDIDTWRPSVFMKDVIDKIFDFAGFTYTSDLFNSTFFGNLIVPWFNEGFALAEDQIAEREFIAETNGDFDIFNNTTQTIIGGTAYEFVRLQYDDYSDPNNLWNDSLYEFEVNDLGYYTMNINSDFTILKTGTYHVPGVLPVEILVKRLSGGVTSIVDAISFDVDIPSGSPGSSETTTLNWSSNQELLYSGDTVWLELSMNSIVYNTITFGNDFEMYLDDGSRLFNQVSEQSIFEGEQVYMNNFIPEVKMKDFLLSVFNMFNLYVTVDPLNEFNLIIETRDDFYASGETKDWTKKLARNKPITLEPLGLLTAREYIYTYAEDDDYYNQRYQDNYGHTYGRRRIEVDNDFITKTQKTEVVFSPTPLVNDGNSSRIIPKIYDADIDDGRKPVDTNLRVLYYAGLLNSVPSWKFRYDAQTTSVTKDEYPYAGHLTHPLAPGQDINFGIPNELFYSANGYTGTLQYTNNNLFNAFHRNQVEELTNKDSKVLTGLFDLTAWDIFKLDFRDQILIDNSYWRINKVSNYNPFKAVLTKVELIKVQDVAPLETEEFDLGGSGEVSQERYPVINRKSLLNGNQLPPFQGTVKGKFNRVSEFAQNFKILGDNNFIGDGSKNVTIFGSGNKVLFGASNVVIINSDNQEVIDDNTTIIDGKRQWKYVDATTAYIAKDRDFVLADASSGAFTVTLPPVVEDVWINVKKTDSSANIVTISPSATGLIDGAATRTLTTQYEAVDFYCDGSNWFIR